MLYFQSRFILSTCLIILHAPPGIKNLLRCFRIRCDSLDNFPIIVNAPTIALHCFLSAYIININNKLAIPVQGLAIFLIKRQPLPADSDNFLRGVTMLLASCYKYAYQLRPCGVSRRCLSHGLGYSDLS